MGNMPCCSTPVLGDCVSTISTCEVEEVKPSQPGRWISVDRLCHHKILKIKKMAISEVGRTGTLNSVFWNSMIANVGRTFLIYFECVIINMYCKSFVDTDKSH